MYASRIAYLSSGMLDGGLYELNLDSMVVTPKASALYLYEAVMDPNGQVLWGARPISGEVVGLDLRTSRVLHRIRTGFGARDIQRDPRNGDLYTCTLWGDVYRVVGTSLAPSKVAWCGRICRNLFLDSERHVLWAATNDGICRYPLAGPAER
jgi:hypothetical protein